MGFGVGVVASVLLFRRKLICRTILLQPSYVLTTADFQAVHGPSLFPQGTQTLVTIYKRPLTFRFGAGVAYSNVSCGQYSLRTNDLTDQCNYSLNPYVLPGTRVLPPGER